MKKGGLGKGLSKLLGDMDAVYTKELGLDKNQVREILIEKIKPNPFQPRKYFDEKSLNELSKSIEEYGLIQPIVVLKKDDFFILVSGERRLRASQILGLKTIAALISNAKEEKLREFALIENIQREDLNPIELANSYKSLIEEHKITQENLANILHKSRSQITNTLRLLNLNPKTQDFIAQGKISQGHAKVLVGLDKKDEEMVVDSILGQKLNVHDTEKMIKKIKNKGKFSLNSHFEFENEMKKITQILAQYGFECKNQKEKLTIYLTSIDKIKKFSKILD
ncbi:ParB/RepB/Spo0J family partition protein [Campylobacter cuniculorum]|uniref:ParB/RepB/Spo0J family partition protein n=1 Tax=Campylobacter cuniculorum TaxID=374106 RepID=UPI0023F35AED|nr:ParB/RepB/Spo0J family partition protein [Campylobacter cuniculorum]